jgi:hypothetical protein
VQCHPCTWHPSKRDPSTLFAIKIHPSPALSNILTRRRNSGLKGALPLMDFFPTKTATRLVRFIINLAPNERRFSSCTLNFRGDKNFFSQTVQFPGATPPFDYFRSVIAFISQLPGNKVRSLSSEARRDS